MTSSERAFPNDPEVLAVYRNMVGGKPEIEIKGATKPYTTHNGHKFSAISKADRIGLRLALEDREDFMDKYGATLFESLPGFFQKEYVCIPVELYGDTRTLRNMFRKSYKYVDGLKTKVKAKKA